MVDHTVKEGTDDVGISIFSCHLISSDVFGMKLVTENSVPKLLNLEWKVIDDTELLKRGLYGYNVETNAQTSQWWYPRSLKLKKSQVQSNVKVMIAVVFDFNGVVQHELLP